MSKSSQSSSRRVLRPCPYRDDSSDEDPAGDLMCNERPVRSPLSRVEQMCRFFLACAATLRLA